MGQNVSLGLGSFGRRSSYLTSSCPGKLTGEFVRGSGVCGPHVHLLISTSLRLKSLRPPFPLSSLQEAPPKTFLLWSEIV